MLRFVPPAGTPLETAEILRGAKAALFSAGDFDRSLSLLAEQVHAQSAVGLCSGRSALWLALKALHRLRPDRNLVALPAYTCFTVPASIVRAGLKPCLVDIDPASLDFDFSRLERISASKLLCIVTSNLFGIPNDVERVRQIARTKGAFVVDDAAQALGASSRGQWAGLRGDAGIFSFGRGKALAAIQGGLAVTNSKEIGAALELEALMQPKLSRAHSLGLLLQMLAYGVFLRPRLYWIPNSIPFFGLGATEFAPGFPVSRMSELTLALLTQIIGKLDEINAKRVSNASSVIEGLAGHPEFTVPAPVSGSKPVYTRLPVIARDAATRDRAVAKLCDAGIGASASYPAALCEIPELKPLLAPEPCHCPEAESVAERLLTLPTHAYVSRRDLSRIVETLASLATSSHGQRISDRGPFVAAAQVQCLGVRFFKTLRNLLNRGWCYSARRSSAIYQVLIIKIKDLSLAAPQLWAGGSTSAATAETSRGSHGQRTSDRGPFVQSPVGTPPPTFDAEPSTGSHGQPAYLDADLDPGSFARHSSLVTPHSKSAAGATIFDSGPLSLSPVAGRQATFDAEIRFASPEPRLKRLLLIAFDFPPRRTSGIYRPTGLTKYLVRLGWQTTVLTVNADAKDLQDPALLERIPPQTEVVRTRYLDFMAWEDSTAGKIRNLGAFNADSSTHQSSIVNRCLRRFAAFVRSCVYFPDRTSGWIPFGLGKAIQLAWRERFDVVYTTSPPRSSLVIGLFLRILSRVPWVAEFRDPWYPPRGKIRRWAERRLLLMIGHKADAVVVVTSSHADEFRSFGIPAQKIKVVPNGFDEDDFRSDRLLPGTHNCLLKPGYLHFTHMGTIYPNDSGKFFEALKDLIREYPVWGKKIRINIVGYPDEVVQRYAEDELLHPLVNIHGFIGHAHSIEVMRASQCLLLFRANRDFAQLCVGGKTYEYLRSGRPILAITYNGPTKTLIQEANAGWVVHPDDKHGIKQALRSAITADSGLAAKRAATQEFAAQFRYDRLAAKMASIFDGISDEKDRAELPVPENSDAAYPRIPEAKPQTSKTTKAALPTGSNH
jgi:perosamine synthetase